MNKIIRILSICLLFLLAVACDKNTAKKWTEQYDLGIKYLEEQNYEEAIVAFTAAIEIEPNQIDAYLNRAEAYLLSGESEETMAFALADYQKALDMDDSLVEAYLGAADIFIQQEEFEQAQETLRKGLEATNSSEIAELLGMVTEILDEQENVLEETVTESEDEQEIANPETENISDSILDYFAENVPELETYAAYISENSSGNASLSIRREMEPVTLDNGKRYYAVYVDESWADHSVNWDRFMVSEELDDILYYDFLSDEYLTLEQWRNAAIYRTF